MSEPDQSLERGVGRDAIWSVTQTVVAGLLFAVSTALSVRRVGETAFGTFTGLTAVLGIGVVIESAIVYAAARLTVGEADAAARVDGMRAARQMTRVTGFGALAPAAVLIGFLPGPVAVASDAAGDTRLAIALVALSTVISLDTALTGGIAKGLRLVAAVASSSIAGELLRVVLILALSSRYGIVGLAWAHLASIVLTNLMLRRRMIGQRREAAGKPSSEARRAMLRFLGPLLVLNLDVEMAKRADPIIIGSLLGPAPTAVFRIGTIVPIRLAALVAKPIDSLFAVIAKEPDHPDVHDLVNFGARVTAFLGGGAFAVTVLVRHDLIELLLGRVSGPAATTLTYLAIASTIDVGLHPAVMHLIANQRQSIMARIAPITLVGNLALTWVLVDLHGLTGAALSTLVVYVINDLVVFPIIYRPVVGTRVVARLVRDLLLAGVLGAIGASITGYWVLEVVDRGVVRMAAVAVVGLIGMAAVGYPALGRGGRARLVSAFGSRPAAAPELPDPALDVDG